MKFYRPCIIIHARCGLLTLLLVLSMAFLWGLTERRGIAASPEPARKKAPQEIWYSPRQPYRPGTGVVDWNEQFESDVRWPTAASRVKVFVLTGGPIQFMTDVQLATMKDFLAKHHMEIALEMGIIEKQPGSKYGGGEGYMFPAEVRAIATRLKNAGITPSYIRMDEPIWFGHYDKNDPWVERLSIDALVKRITKDTVELTSVFPNIKVVDIDTIPPLTMEPDWRATYKEFKEKLEVAMGRPILAAQVDLQWGNPSWKHDLKEFADFVHGLGMRFGIIYNSDGGGADDREWLKNTVKGFTEIECETGIIPEEPVMQSWEAFPTHALPESSDAAHTYLIARYLMPRTGIVAARARAAVRGVLVDERGRAVAGAHVAMEAPYFNKTLPLPTIEVSGTVPAKAKTAIMGIRINCECLCDGQSDLLVGKFDYHESGSGSVTQTLDYPAEIQRAKPASVKSEIVTIGGENVAHIVADTGHVLGFNSPAFTVTPGAEFRFAAKADMMLGEALYGRIILIWLNDQKQGFRAEPLIVERKYVPCGAAVTGEKGRFSIKLPDGSTTSGGPLRLEFSGSPVLRPSIVIVP